MTAEANRDGQQNRWDLCVRSLQRKRPVEKNSSARATNATTEQTRSSAHEKQGTEDVRRAGGPQAASTVLRCASDTRWRCCNADMAWPDGIKGYYSKRQFRGSTGSGRKAG